MDHETHIPAEQSTPRQDPWLFVPHENKERTHGAEAPPRQGPPRPRSLIPPCPPCRWHASSWVFSYRPPLGPCAAGSVCTEGPIRALTLGCEGLAYSSLGSRDSSTPRPCPQAIRQRGGAEPLQTAHPDGPFVHPEGHTLTGSRFYGPLDPPFQRFTTGLQAGLRRHRRPAQAGPFTFWDGPA